MQKTSKLIFSPQLAQYLLQCGYKVIELKRNRNDNTTVFVFEYDRSMSKAIEEWRKER